ncbi:MAG: hypothetical protein U5R31_03740 [Acidimicrobiia bacterium]|nr:hypothetical protein [Acidimicrobiia bacterium]
MSSVRRLGASSASPARLAGWCSSVVERLAGARLVADAAVLLRDVEVRHLFHDGRTQEHPPTEGVRRDAAVGTGLRRGRRR